MSTLWDIHPDKQRDFLKVMYTPSTTGYKTFRVFVESEAQNFTIPIAFNVIPKNLRLNKSLLDLGVLTDPSV